MQPGSGLIDIPTLVGVTRGADNSARAVVVPPPRGLVIAVEPVAIPMPDDRATRRVLSLICLVLFAAMAMLAIEALR